MVSAHRKDEITKRDFPIRETAIRREPLRHQRLLRDRLPVSRELFIDRDDVPPHVQLPIDDRINISYDLQFAPLVNNNPGPSPLPIPAGEEPDTASVSSGLSECSTIVVDLDNPTTRIQEGLLRAWERNAEIQPLINNRATQTASPRHISPSYSPVPFNDPSSLMSEYNDYEEESINRMLEYMNSEEFLNSIVEPEEGI